MPQAFHRIVPGEEFALVFEGMAERKVGNVVDERCEHHNRLLLGANRHAVVPEGADDAPGHCRGPQRVFESGVHTPRVDQVGRAGLPDAPQALHLVGVHNAAFRIGEAEVSVDGVPNDHLSVLSRSGEPICRAWPPVNILHGWSAVKAKIHLSALSASTLPRTIGSRLPPAHRIVSPPGFKKGLIFLREMIMFRC